MRLWFDVVVTFDRKGLRRRDKNRWKALDETNSTVSLRASQSTRRTHKFHQTIWIPGIHGVFHGFYLFFLDIFGFSIFWFYSNRRFFCLSVVFLVFIGFLCFSLDFYGFLSFCVFSVNIVFFPCFFRPAVGTRGQTKHSNGQPSVAIKNGRARPPFYKILSKMAPQGRQFLILSKMAPQGRQKKYTI